jgi:predicted nucleotidyltransferase component of viral defense system
MTKNSLATSIAARLRRIADAQQVPYANVLTSFLIERAVARLSQNKTLNKHLVFKGGFVSLRVYTSPRFTVDLDAVLHGMSKLDAIEEAKDAMANDLCDGVWFHFEKTQDLATQQEYGGTRLAYRAGLGEKLSNILRAQILNIDIGVGDPVTPAPRELSIPSYLSAESLSWQVYTAETIVAEKLHALIVLGSINSRSKDLFDLSYLLPQTSRQVLVNAIANTFQHRQTEVPKSFSQVLAKMDLTTLKRGWRSAMKDFREAPDFDAIFVQVLESLTKYRL